MSMISVGWRWTQPTQSQALPEAAAVPPAPATGGGGSGGPGRTRHWDGGDHPAAHVAILIDPALEPVAAALQQELGPGFAMVVWPPSEGDRGP